MTACPECPRHGLQRTVCCEEDDVFWLGGDDIETPLMITILSTETPNHRFEIDYSAPELIDRGKAHPTSPRESLRRRGGRGKNRRR